MVCREYRRLDCQEMVKIDAMLIDHPLVPNDIAIEQLLWRNADRIICGS